MGQSVAMSNLPDSSFPSLPLTCGRRRGGVNRLRPGKSVGAQLCRCPICRPGPPTPVNRDYPPLIRAGRAEGVDAGDLPPVVGALLGAPRRAVSIGTPGLAPSRRVGTKSVAAPILFQRAAGRIAGVPVRAIGRLFPVIRSVSSASSIWCITRSPVVEA